MGQGNTECYVNRDNDLIKVNTETWSPVQSSGLSAPHLKIQYYDPRVHEVLYSAFGDIFPKIIKDEETGEFYYEQLNESGRNLILDADAVKNIADVPRAEMMRLMEGWIRLRRRLQEEKIPNELQPILLNFHVPNPRRSLDRYRIHQQGDEKRLVILWGFEEKDAPAISVERAIALLMDVPLGNLRSILSSSMPANTGTVPIRASVEEAGKRIEEVKQRRDSQGGAKILLGLVAAVFVLLAGVGAFALMQGGKDEPKSVERIVIREQVPVAEVKPVEKESKVEPVAEEPKAAPAPAPELVAEVKVEQNEPAKPEVNPLDAMAKAQSVAVKEPETPLLESMLGKGEPGINGMVPKGSKKDDLMKQMTQ